MTPDLETSVRDDLTTHALDAHVRVDLDSILTTGRRTVARRRLAGIAGVAALALIAGGAYVLAPRPTQVAVPAGTPSASSTSSPQPASPDPTAPEPTQDAAQNASFDVAGNASSERPWTTAEPATITLSALADGNGGYSYKVHTYDSSGQALPVVGGGALSSDVGGTWSTGSTIPGYIVGVVRGKPTALLALPAPSLSSTGDHKAIPGTDLTAFYFRCAKPADADAVSGLLWIDPDGSVHNHRGQVVASATLGSGTRSLVVFKDASLDVVGASSNGGTYTSPLQAKADKVTKAGGWDSTSKFGWVAAILPQGSTDVKATYRSSVTDRTLDVANDVGPDHEVYVLVGGTSNDMGVITQLSWTDASGKRVTVDASR